LLHPIKKKYSKADRKKSSVETNRIKVFITYDLKTKPSLSREDLLIDFFVRIIRRLEKEKKLGQRTHLWDKTPKYGFDALSDKKRTPAESRR